MFRCILCGSKNALNIPIKVTKKVNDYLTLEDCIRRNLNCSTAILDLDETSEKLACNNCYAEFVNFYEFLSNTERIYEKLTLSKVIKPEFDASLNFVDVGGTEGATDFKIVKSCTIKLERIDDEIKTDNDEIVKEEVSQKEEEDSDFEWPTNDDWLPPEVDEKPPKENDKSEPKARPLRKKMPTFDERDKDYDPETDPVLQPKKKRKKVVTYKKKEYPHLPRDRVTAEILATEGNLITIDGVTYQIPRRKRNKPFVPKKTRGHKRSLDPSRRPHPAFDPEGEARIRAFVDVKCHVCGEQYLTFFRLRKHVKKAHPGEKEGYLVCCNKKFTRRYELLDHLDKHDRSVRHVCKFCNDGVDFGNQAALRSHIKANHVNLPAVDDKDHICELCGKNYSTAQGLKVHMKIHENEDDSEEQTEEVFKNQTKDLPSSSQIIESYDANVLESLNYEFHSM